MLGSLIVSSHALSLQVKRLFKELKVEFTAVELDQVGKLPAHLCLSCIMYFVPLPYFRTDSIMLKCLCVTLLNYVW